MKIILTKQVEHLGEAGEVVNVKPGYARNYLVPQGLAYGASAANMARLEAEQKQAGESARRDYLEARRRASQLEGLELVFQVRAGEEGKLFGSVTSAEVAARIQEHIDFDLDRRRLILDDTIKAIGEFKVPVRLHSEVEVEVTVQVVAED